MARRKKKNAKIPVEEKLRYLYKLQEINTQLDEIKKLQGELPLEVEALEGEIAKLEGRVNKYEEEKKELEVEVTKHQNQIKESEALIEKYTKQQDEVKNNREYEALTREVELQKLDIQLAKKRIRETHEKLGRKEETLEASRERLTNKQKDLEIKNEELEKISKKTEKKETKYLKREKRARKKIDDNLLEYYDRIRHAYKNGLAVVSLDRNSCGGCFSRVPPQTQLEMESRKRIINCEHCGRILVVDNILEPMEEFEEQKK